MSTKKALFFLIISAGFIMTSCASAASSDNNRYFIKATSSIWKKSFPNHATFKTGYTANLSDWQLRVAKVFGMSVEPVRKLNILSVSPSPTPTPTPASKKKTPDQINWGMRFVYSDPLLEKTSGGEDIKIAVLDTGIDTDNVNLRSRISDCKDFTTASPTKDKCEDKNGHGTQVAGIIAADGNKDGTGMFGVVPSASLMIYKVCDFSGTCFADDVATAIYTATDNGANIINIGLGSDKDSALIEDAIDYAINHGVLVVAAAGNDGSSGKMDYPAFNSNVVSVGAIDSDKSVPDWSSTGTNEDSKEYTREDGDIEMVAPGVNIGSTSTEDEYIESSGTSMASAFISGLAAKMWQKDAKDSAAATRAILHKLSQDIGTKGDDNSSGWGAPTL